MEDILVPIEELTKNFGILGSDGHITGLSGSEVEPPCSNTAMQGRVY